jgi:hypothetical protein
MSHHTRHNHYNRTSLDKVTQHFGEGRDQAMPGVRISIVAHVRRLPGRKNQRLKRRSTVNAGTLGSVFRAYLGNSKVGTDGDILAIRIPWVSARRALSAAPRLETAWERDKINAYQNRPLRNP